MRHLHLSCPKPAVALSDTLEMGEVIYDSKVIFPPLTLLQAHCKRACPVGVPWVSKAFVS